MRLFSTHSYLSVLAIFLNMSSAMVFAEPASDTGGAEEKMTSHLPEGYEGKPFEDDRYKGGAQVVPGVVHCAYFDLGGEGVANHPNTESANSNTAPPVSRRRR